MIRRVAVAIALTLALTSGAHAAPYRLPKSGVPALAVDAPAGWLATYDQFGNLQLTAADHRSSVQLSMIEDRRVATTPAPDVANSVFRALAAPPYNRSEADTIAGRPGVAFIGVLPSNGKLLDMRVVLVKLDASHYACVTVLKRRPLKPAQETALIQLVGRVSVLGVR